MAAECCCWWQIILLKRKWTRRDWHHHTYQDQKIFKESGFNRHRRQGQENLELEAVSGSLMCLLQSGSASHILMKNRFVELIIPRGSPTETKYAYGFLLSVKFIFLVVFTIKAVRIEQCTWLSLELWLSETDKTVVMQRPTGSKFSTSCLLHFWLSKRLSQCEYKHKQLFWSLLMTHACGRRVRLVDSSANWD